MFIHLIDPANNTYRVGPYLFIINVCQLFCIKRQKL